MKLGKRNKDVSSVYLQQEDADCVRVHAEC